MKSSKPPIILTTDFGLEDEYVGVLKGVILSIDKDATIIDLTHAISPQNIAEAARIIGRNHRYFPDGSIHICIVDPGVGTSRRIIAVNAANQIFVGPDNGVFTNLIRAELCTAVHEVTNEQWFLESISTTFHGRDIMAPTAARLSLGEPVESAGPLVSISGCTKIDDNRPIVTPTGIDGIVDSIDRFGNIITNIHSDDLFESTSWQEYSVVMGDIVMRLSDKSYAEMNDKTPTALINSSGVIEIAVKNGNAAAILGVEPGSRVLVRT